MKHACVDASDDRAFSGRNQTSSVGDVGSGDREVQLQKLVDRKLQDIQNAQLKISVNGKSSSLESRSVRLFIRSSLPKISLDRQSV
jgi:hypothetical protein